MVRFRSEVWRHFEINGKRTTCKFCGKEAYKNPSRMPYHLTKCPKCPESIKKKMFAGLPKSLSKSRSNSSSQSSQELGDYDITDIEIVHDDQAETDVISSDKFNSNPIHFVDTDNCCTRTFEQKSDDEFTLFGNTVARKLRSIKNHRAQVIAQYYINTVLFRAEMTNFDQGINLPTPQEFSLFDSINQESKESVNESLPISN